MILTPCILCKACVGMKTSEDVRPGRELQKSHSFYYSLNFKSAIDLRQDRARNQEAKSPCKIFRLPWKNVLGIVENYWTYVTVKNIFLFGLWAKILFRI